MEYLQIYRKKSRAVSVIVTSSHIFSGTAPQKGVDPIRYWKRRPDCSRHWLKLRGLCNELDSESDGNLSSAKSHFCGRLWYATLAEATLRIKSRRPSPNAPACQSTPSAFVR